MGRRGARSQGDGVALLVEQIEQQGGQITANQGNDCWAFGIRRSVLADPSGGNRRAKGTRIGM